MNQKLSTIDFGLIGHPLGHSFSKAFFSTFFKEEGLDLSYDNFDIPALTPQSLYSFLLLNLRLKGFNVTAPYKEDIVDYLDSVSAPAIKIGAVNTVKVRRSEDGRILGLDGFNTDIIGFSESIKPLLDGIRSGAGALILGTGGAAKAAAAAMEELGRPWLKVSRSKKTESVISYSEINTSLLEKFPIIINATPVGTYPDIDACPPFPADLLGEGNIVFDMIYNPEETQLLRRASERGATTKNGLEMLYRQAIESFKIWTNQNL